MKRRPYTTMSNEFLMALQLRVDAIEPLHVERAVMIYVNKDKIEAVKERLATVFASEASVDMGLGIGMDNSSRNVQYYLGLDTVLSEEQRTAIETLPTEWTVEAPTWKYKVLYRYYSAENLAKIAAIHKEAGF